MEMRASYDKNALEFLLGTFAGVLGRLEERVLSPDGCQAEKLWNRNCDVDASGIAHCALAAEGRTALKAMQGMMAWSHSRKSS